MAIGLSMSNQLKTIDRGFFTLVKDGKNIHRSRRQEFTLWVHALLNFPSNCRSHSSSSTRYARSSIFWAYTSVTNPVREAGNYHTTILGLSCLSRFCNPLNPARYATYDNQPLETSQEQVAKNSLISISIQGSSMAKEPSIMQSLKGTQPVVSLFHHHQTITTRSI